MTSYEAGLVGHHTVRNGLAVPDPLGISRGPSSLATGSVGGMRCTRRFRVVCFFSFVRRFTRGLSAAPKPVILVVDDEPHVYFRGDHRAWRDAIEA